MSIIFLILLSIILIYRIYIIVKEIILIIKNPKFKQGCLITILYFSTLFTFMMFFNTLVDTISTFISDDKKYYLSDALLASVLVLGILFYILIIKKYPETKLLFKLVFLILTLGFTIFLLYSKFDNKNNSNGDKEFVSPHNVNGYTRADGTKVPGYYRDGDGNPNTMLTKEDGGGYWRNK